MTKRTRVDATGSASDSPTAAQKQTTPTTVTLYTPGPWRAVKSRGLNSWELKAADGACFAKVWGVDAPVPNGVQPKNAKTNARLIAAAPDLLAALKTLVNEPGCADPDCCTPARRAEAARVVARAAIAKAEGRPAPATKGAPFA